jgi:hypothetical protein
VGCADAVPTTEYVNTQGKVRAVCGESRTHGSREGGTGDPARDDRPLLYVVLKVTCCCEATRVTAGERSDTETVTLRVRREAL